MVESRSFRLVVVGSGRGVGVGMSEGKTVSYSGSEVLVRP
jgi:hypothetical protein